jgi:prepilin-type N-terminal cleavage/methylation domain-containing protein
MIKFNREEGLTLIELLITIAVIAIVAAISVPVISNVVGSSRDSAADAMTVNAQTFSEKYHESGTLSYVEADDVGTLTGYVDLDGDGVVDADEAMETLAIDLSTFSVFSDEATEATPMGTTLPAIVEDTDSYPASDSTDTVTDFFVTSN